MPDPAKYKPTEKARYMEDCMHQTVKVEKKPKDQALAVCLSVWNKGHGGKQSMHENNFLKYESLADKVKKLAGEMEKQAYPSVTTVYGKDVDLYFEHLEQDARNNVLKDLMDEKGDPKDIEIKLPDFPVLNKKGLDIPFIRGVDLQRNNLSFLRKLIGRTPHGNPNVTMDYDPILHKYYQVEPEPVLYGAPVPQVQYDLHGKFPEVHEPSYSFKTAKTDIAYSRGCAMAPTPEDLAKSVIDYGKAFIPDSDLHTEKEDQGREDDIHITLFYGFTEDNIEKLSEILKSVKPFTVRLGLVNAFKDKKDYDVLKISVESPELEKLHYLLEKEMKNDNKYPTYAPHMTVCYVKKGKADKVIGDDKFRGKEFKVSHIDYSNKDNVRTKIKIG